MNNAIKEVCRDCGSTEEIINELCYTCEVENYVYCTICDEYIRLNDALYHHRHVFEIGDAWVGSGGVDMDEHYENEIKTSLLFVLDKIPTMTAPLVNMIQQGKMDFDAIHLYGPTLGAISVWICLKDSGNNLHFFTDDFEVLGNEVIDNDDEEQQKALEYCVRWLISLDDKTKEANEMTLQWINEWQQKQEGAL